MKIEKHPASFSLMPALWSWPSKTGPCLPWILKFYIFLLHFSKKGCFLSFNKEKWKIHCWPPGQNSSDANACDLVCTFNFESILCHFTVCGWLVEFIGQNFLVGFVEPTIRRNKLTVVFFSESFFKLFIVLIKIQTEENTTKSHKYFNRNSQKFKSHCSSAARMRPKRPCTPRKQNC